MAASAPRRRLSSEQRRDQLVDVALALAAGGDLASVSVEDIAARAGVSEGLLYHYFPTKDALLLAAVQRAADSMTTALDPPATGEPLAALTASLAAYLDHVEADPTGWRALLQARTGALAEVAATVDRQGRRLTLTLLGIDRPTPLLAAAIDGWAALERQVCLAWLAEPTTSRAAIEDLLLSSFLGLLTAAAAHDEQARDALSRLSPAPSPQQAET